MVRIFIGSLVLLIVLPFTAPVRTCDLSALLGHPPTERDRAADVAMDALLNAPAMPTPTITGVAVERSPIRGGAPVMAPAAQFGHPIFSLTVHADHLQRTTVLRV